MAVEEARTSVRVRIRLEVAVDRVVAATILALGNVIGNQTHILSVIISTTNHKQSHLQLKPIVSVQRRFWHL